MDSHMGKLKIIPLIIVSILPGGCFTPHELVRSGRVSLVPVNGRTLRLQRPVVWQESDELVISGSVRRRLASSGLGPNRVYVAIFSPEHQLLAQIEAPIRPWPIPLEGARTSGYTARTDWKLEPGQTIQVSLTPGQTTKQ